MAWVRAGREPGFLKAGRVGGVRGVGGDPLAKSEAWRGGREVDAGGGGDWNTTGIRLSVIALPITGPQ